MRGRGWATTSDVTKIKSPRRRSTMPAPKARTSCWAPPMLTRRTSSKSSGLVSSAVPGRILAALDTRISTGPNAASASFASRGPPGRGGRPPPLPPRPGWTQPPRRTPRRGAPRAPRDGRRGPTPAPPRRRCPRRRRSPPSAGVRGEARRAASTQRHGGRQRGEAPHVDGVHAPHARRVHLVVLHQRPHLGQRDPRLHTGERGPHAEVPPAAEADQVLGPALEVIALGVGEDV